MKLLNKVAVITGGNSGIGLATAREFTANGAKVAIFGRNRQTLDQATAAIGPDVLAVQGDVRKLADLDRLFDTAAKSAVRSLARSLSVELLPRQIRVSVLSPGMTDTPIITREGGMPGATPEQIAAIITKTIPMRRRGTPDEMAKAMLFLASDDSSYCVGSELMADGGLTQLVNPA